LAEALREQTRALHTQVERSGFMQTLLRGHLDRPAYCRLLRNLHVIYCALEGALARHAGHPGIAPLNLAALARSRLLAEDLAQLQGADWPTELAVLPAAARYARRIQDLDQAAPGLLLAHAYVRYLGDLSGGQMLQRVVGRALALEGDAGTRFYDFGGPDRVAELARRFRDGLDGLVTDAKGTTDLVAEAQWGFAQHGRLFDELQRSGGGTERMG
jgi:heme oxygenase